jgi:hypothetical protein
VLLVRFLVVFSVRYRDQTAALDATDEPRRIDRVPGAFSGIAYSI